MLRSIFFLVRRNLVLSIQVAATILLLLLFSFETEFNSCVIPVIVSTMIALLAAFSALILKGASRLEPSGENSTPEEK